jgi:hypothetical protein
LSNSGRAVGTKSNVLQSVGFVRWVAALLILPKRWFVCSFVPLLNYALSLV